MQRVRAGLTGLAAIFLMVLIAAAGLKPGRSTAHTGAPAETLAMLGVAPGSSGVAPRVPDAPAAVRPHAPVARAR